MPDRLRRLVDAVPQYPARDTLGRRLALLLAVPAFVRACGSDRRAAVLLAKDPRKVREWLMIARRLSARGTVHNGGVLIVSRVRAPQDGFSRAILAAFVDKGLAA